MEVLRSQERHGTGALVHLNGCGHGHLLVPVKGIFGAGLGFRVWGLGFRVVELVWGLRLWDDENRKKACAGAVLALGTF